MIGAYKLAFFAYTYVFNFHCFINVCMIKTHIHMSWCMKRVLRGCDDLHI